MGRVQGFVAKYRRHLLHLVIEEHLAWIVRSIPGPLGVLLRWGFYRWMFARLGGPAIVYPGAYLSHCYGIRAGRGLSVNTGAVIDGRGGIEIGDDVLVGPHVVITSSRHAHEQLDRPMAQVDQRMQPVTIGDDVWIGAHVVIPGGVRIGRGCLIAAGAVVTRDVPDYAVAAGVPAVVIGDRREVPDGGQAIEGRDAV